MFQRYNVNNPLPALLSDRVHKASFHHELAGGGFKTNKKEVTLHNMHVKPWDSLLQNNVDAQSLQSSEAGHAGLQDRNPLRLLNRKKLCLAVYISGMAEHQGIT